MERTILLVDDEEDIGAALARLLRRDGYTILRATSGEEALALLAERSVGVVISDQRMPGMTGVAFLTMVKELYPDTIRIILSGYADLDAVTDAINHGAIYKFLAKPWDNDALCAEVLGAFRHHELVQEKEHLLRDIQTANQMLAQVNEEWVAAVAQRDIQIERISYYSPQTNLPNRRLFLERLEQDTAQAQRDDRLVALMLIDVDRFKQINDSFNHAAGDQLLQTVAGRLKAQARTGDTLAHLGGDEFGLVLPGMTSAQNAADVAQRLIDSFSREAVSVGGSEIFITICVGIAIYPFDGVDTNTLMKNLAAALRYAKEAGPSNFQYYETQMNATAWQRLTLETELRRAQERDEFLLYYQPKLDLSSGDVVGMEALLRWQNPVRGLVAPDEFIPLLEKTGLILPVGSWVLDRACRQTAEWQLAGLANAHVAVNLSVMQLKQPDFVSMVRETLERYGLCGRPGMLELELTESLLMKDLDGTIHILSELQEMGVHLSIDDFGTGYSCLSYLKHLPVNSLKIDRSFIRHLPIDSADAAIVKSIIALGKGLGLKVIAEGVETVEQLACLQAMKCDEIQGYLISRPVPADQMTQLLLSGEGLDTVMEA